MAIVNRPHQNITLQTFLEQISHRLGFAQESSGLSNGGRSRAGQCRRTHEQSACIVRCVACSAAQRSGGRCAALSLGCASLCCAMDRISSHLLSSHLMAILDAHHHQPVRSCAHVCCSHTHAVSELEHSDTGDDRRRMPTIGAPLCNHSNTCARETSIHPLHTHHE